MTVEEFLKNDNSYLVVPHNTSSIFSKCFWNRADNKNLGHSFAGTKGNQRESYEAGVKIGWEMAKNHLKNSMKIPNNVDLSDKEYKEIMALISAFGYKFVYTDTTYYPCHARNFASGLNICKDRDAIEAGIVLTKEAKQKVMEVLKENTESRLFH